MKDLEFFLMVATAIGIIYKISKIESAIYERIDKVKDDLEYEVRKYDKEVSNHIVRCNERDELYEYKLHGAQEKIEHKFARTLSYINQIQEYLASHDLGEKRFIKREEV